MTFVFIAAPLSVRANQPLQRPALHGRRETCRSGAGFLVSCHGAAGIVGSMKAATLSGLLGNEDRLRVVGAIALGARTIDDVAQAAGLAADDVRRALPRLVAAGIVDHKEGLRVDMA